MLKLFGVLTSPFVRKVRMVLAEKNIPYEMVIAAPNEPGSPVPGMNPLAKIPTLLTDDERSVYDSRVIVEYLDTLHPEPALLPPAGMERVSVKRWEALGDGICDAAVHIIWEGRRENELQRSPQWIAKQLGKINRAVPTLAAEIGAHEYCHGGRLTLADLAVMNALAYLAYRFPAIRWREFPELGAYFERHAARGSFTETALPPPKQQTEEATMSMPWRAMTP